MAEDIELSPEQARVQPWFAINGDQTLRLDYRLDSQSVVYDVGGYLGDWSRPIYQKFRCRIEIMEPVKVFYEKLRQDFKNHPEINVHHFGLAGKNRKSKISLEAASSSTFKSSSHSEPIELVKASEFIAKKKESHIDLMKINIEGGEYELLEDLIDSGLIKKIGDIQVQFHIFVPDARQKRRQLQTKLSQTHYLTYNYPFIWENWRRR